MSVVNPMLAAALFVCGVAALALYRVRAWHRLPRRVVFLLGMVVGAALIALTVLVRLYGLTR